MSFLSPPKPPDPSQVANAQQAYNTQAAQAQQRQNMVNQTTPFGSLTYASDPSAPSGLSANVALTPDLQELARTQQATALNLGRSAAGMYSAAPNLDVNALTGKMSGMFEDYYKPIFTTQQSNLDSQLRNQGIAPGTAAWDRAQNLLSRNQNDARTQFYMGVEPLAFNQAVQRYQLPLQTEQSLLTGSSPQNPMFQQTPQIQIQPANYTGPAEQQYQQSYQQYGDMMKGIGQLASIGMAPFTGGLSGIGGFGGAGNLFFGGGSPSGYGR